MELPQVGLNAGGVFAKVVVADRNAPRTAKVVRTRFDAGVLQVGRVSDLVRGIRLLIDAVPQQTAPHQNDSLSPVAPWRVVNIGNSTKIRLEEFIDAIEVATGRKAQRNYMDK